MAKYLVRSTLMNDVGKGGQRATVDSRTGLIIKPAKQGEPYVAGDVIELSEQEANAILASNAKKENQAIELIVDAPAEAPKPEPPKPEPPKPEPPKA
jgi:hypothetical protein